uniref:Pentatricopeptide repeat-containing protein At1g20230 n=1 Tax=Anthurium amnicola TaxID=1678845 RepID=A0A1D1XEG9_9ARAE
MPACSPPTTHNTFKFLDSHPPSAGDAGVVRAHLPRRPYRALGASGSANLGLQTQRAQPNLQRRVDSGRRALLNCSREGETPTEVCPVEAHDGALSSGLLSHSTIGSRLAVLYSQGASGSSVGNVHRLLEEIPERTVALYASLIGSFVRSRQWGDVLAVFVSMVGENMKPDKFLLPKILKACSELENLSMGAIIHGYMLKQWHQLQLDVFVGNSLIDMYAKCGDLDSSWTVFDTMTERDVVSWTALLVAYTEAGLMDDAAGIFSSMQSKGVKPDLISWNALISGFARKGEVSVALDLLEDMQDNGVRPGLNSWNGVVSGFVQSANFEDALDVFLEMCSHDARNAVTIASILPACSGLKSLSLGEEIHAYAIKHGFIKNVFVGGSLIDMYMKCSKRGHAEKLFSKMENKTATVWNEMIAAYANEGNLNKALHFLQLMLEDELKPDIITYNTVLSAYARSGQKSEAFKLFSEMEQMDLKPNIVSINALIAGFQQYGLSREALELLRVIQYPKDIHTVKSFTCEDFSVGMLNDSIRPNAVTITSVLSACTDLKAQPQGMQIHGYVLRNSLESNIFVSTALVDMYAKCENMDYAVRVFGRIREKNTVTWNTLMAGYNSNVEPENALKLFPEMLYEGYIPSSITLLILLLACGSTAALSLGRELHGYIVKSIFDDPPLTVENTLVGMYTKCGSIQEARLVFDCTVPKDLVLWNTMISAYSMHGLTKDTICLFEQMEQSGLKPDHITFTSLLSACRQEGFVEEGWRYFNSMEDIYGIKPSLEHFTCMVSIMGGVGLLEEALDFIGRMPFEPDAYVWAALLRACRVHSNYEVGQKVARILFELEPRNISNYIILSNIYATAGMWDAAMDVRISIRTRGLKPVTTCSWIYIQNKIHTFKSGESSHPELDKILEEWDRLAIEMDKRGYDPQDVVFLDEEDADDFSCFHPEKLAICFGIISLPGCFPIRISKNVRMCIDCHTSAKFIALINDREVFVRDGCFYHHFRDGICSCGDKW